MKVVITIEIDNNELSELFNEAKETEKKKTVKRVSHYARWFDESNKNWTKNPEYNLMFLRTQQSYANDLLRAQGYLFLNDVYEMLGIAKSKAGQIVGWVYDEKNHIGDNFVDFGICNDCPEAIDFVNGKTPNVLLDFNVDGYILDRI